MTVLEKLRESLREIATRYNSASEVAPACLLWFDSKGEWTSIVPLLFEIMPELLELGAFDIDRRRGPAIWIKHVLAGNEKRLATHDFVPVVYVPHLSADYFSNPEMCEPEHKPLVELVYRSLVWKHTNGKEFTKLAFVMNEERGMGLAITNQAEVRRALEHSDIEFFTSPMASWGDVIRAEELHSLVAPSDPTQDFLHWLARGDEWKMEQSEKQWRIFVERTTATFKVNPESEPRSMILEKFAKRSGPLAKAWSAFCSNPLQFDGIYQAFQPITPIGSLEATLNPSMVGWPQWNRRQEEKLRETILNGTSADAPLTDTEIAKLRITIEEHTGRASLPWAKLGRAPLACAAESMAKILGGLQMPPEALTPEEVMSWYVDAKGYEVDSAARKLMAGLHYEVADLVSRFLGVFYRQWLNRGATKLQETVQSKGYPGKIDRDRVYADGTCLLFVDGLRYDLGIQLAATLKNLKIESMVKPTWAPFPTLTNTGKYAVSPLAGQLEGSLAPENFLPSMPGTTMSIDAAFGTLLQKAGWQKLAETESGDPSGRAWTAIDDIDALGHTRELRMATNLDSVIEQIAGRLQALFAAGWKNIEIVTDHGWLLLPEPLPLCRLESGTTTGKGGRTVAFKKGMENGVGHLPWTWNHGVEFAYAPGIEAFRANTYYAHGGISPQECIVPRIVLQPKTGQSLCEVYDMSWNGMVLRFKLRKLSGKVRCHILTSPGAKGEALALPKEVYEDDSKTSLMIEDDERLGTNAYFCVFDENQKLVLQRQIVIGQEP